MRKAHLLLLTALVTIVGSGQATAQFTPLGTADTYVFDMSADGTVVVGLRATYGPAFRWTAATGTVDIGSVSTKVAISRDGSTIVGKAIAADRLIYASIWQSGRQWVALPPPEGWQEQDGDVTGAYDVSADGSVIVGLAHLTGGRTEAFRYHASTGTVTLGTLTGGYSRASAVSGDGRVVAGWDDLKGKGTGLGRWFGTVWWEGSERLLHPYNAVGQVEGSNDVGSILVGRGHPLNFLHAFRYTSWDGHIDDLGAIKRTAGGDGVGNPIIGAEDLEDSSIALAVSDDGNVVVGTSGWEPPTDAFIWTPATKILKLGEYLTSKGITGHENWRLITATAVSPDGKIIAGSGINNDTQRIEGYVGRIP